MNNLDPLKPFPHLRALRDSLLARDPAATKAGAEVITRTLLAAALNVRLPDDRLVKTGDAIAMTGLEESDFFSLADREGVKPVRKLKSGYYWRARDIYHLVDGDDNG